MNLVVTDKQVNPELDLPCPTCGEKAEWVGTHTVDHDELIWRDKYWCKSCRKHFNNKALALYCEPETGDFYAYRDLDAVPDAQMRLFDDAK